MNEQVLGLITGIIFGFLLQRARVVRFEKQISLLLFKDMTLIKVMLSAVIVGAIGIYFLKDLGVEIAFRHKSMNLGAIIFGGMLFGLGWVLSGYCPGTSLAALAEGRLHAFWAILGMLSGAAIFAEAYPFLKKTILSLKDWGAVSLVEILGINHWFIILGMGIIFLFVFKFFKIKNI